MEQERRRTERRTEWNFEITDQGWSWAATHPGGTQERSSKIYETLKDAADEAMQRGFGQWRAPERRAGDRRDMEH